MLNSSATQKQCKLASHLRSHPMNGFRNIGLLNTTDPSASGTIDKFLNRFDKGFLNMDCKISKAWLHFILGHFG